MDEFLSRLRTSVRSSGKQELLVYIHGFATDWPTALQRTAALSVSLGIDGAPVLLSWPSRGDVLSYVADGNELTAAIARNFGAVLDALLASSGADRILVVAHSMGARFALSGLEQSTQFKSTSRPVRLVFGSPDVDTDDFQDRTRTLLTGAKKATLYSSRDDRALQISRSLNQSSRAGDASSRLNVAGLEVIDTTDVAKEWSFDGLAAHNDFAMSALDDFRAIVWHAMPPENRCILVPAKDPARPAPWRMGTPGSRCKVETFRFATYAARQMGLQPAWELVEKERKKACPTSQDDCKLWTETAAVVNSLKVVR
jgi:esterase/lipase superfamily enzyme